MFIQCNLCVNFLIFCIYYGIIENKTVNILKGYRVLEILIKDYRDAPRPRKEIGLRNEIFCIVVGENVKAFIKRWIEEQFTINGLLGELKPNRFGILCVDACAQFTK